MLTTRLLCVLLVMGLARTVCGQDYLLQNPADPQAASTATIVGTDLVITDAGAKQFVYVRRPDLDTLDGVFQAFYSKAANQYLRWPVSGTGNMQIGRLVGPEVLWTPSRMQIRGGAGGPVAANPFLPGSPLHAATLHLGPEKFCTAQIDAAGQLHFYIGYRDRWRHFSAPHPPGILVAGAPLHLTMDANASVPRVYTIGAKGRFVQVVGGEAIDDVPSPPGVKFVPGSDFAAVQTVDNTELFATERHGRLWALDLAGGKHHTIEGHLGVLEPGVPIKLMADGNELYMTDRHGVLIAYSRDGMGKWHGPELIADDFSSAGHLAVWLHPKSKTVEIAAVDRHGKLQLVRQEVDVWKKEPLPEINLPAGAPLTAFETKAGLSISAILADGRWVEFFESGGKWQDRIIASGFPPMAPLAFTKTGPMMFASDVTGRLIAAYWTGGEWYSVVCSPGSFAGGQIGFAPRLVSRKYIANRPIDSAVVELQNTTREELVVRVRDGRIPGKVEEITIPPQGSSKFTADRDSGGTLEEVYLAPGPNGPIEQVKEFPVPPKPYYDMVVYAKRVTYQYIDRRKKKGPVPDFNESSLVSLGAFPLAPGDVLQSGTRLDVHQIATMARNPGASAVIDP